MAFGDNLKRLREERHLTQQELAYRVGVTQPMITQYEKYMKVPTIIVGVEIAKVLNTTCEELVKN